MTHLLHIDTIFYINQNGERGDREEYSAINLMRKTTGILLSLILSALCITPNGSYAAEPAPVHQIVSASSNGIRIAMDLNTGLFGYVDEEGKQIIPLAYDTAWDFVDGIGVVRNKAGEYIAFDTSGDVRIKFKKELGEIKYYGNYGIASLPTGNPETPQKYALLDNDGNAITGYIYDELGRFSYYSRGKTGTVSKLIYYGPLTATKAGKSFLIDKAGNVISNQYEYIQGSQYGEYDMFTVSKKIGSTNYKYGFINGNGKEILSCIYDGAGEIKEGRSLLEKDGKWAVVNANGTILTDFAYESMDYYQEGLAPVKKGLWGCIDISGNIVVPCIYDTMGQSVNGKLDFYLSDGKTEVKLKNPIIDQHDINIYINGNWIYTDQQPIIQKDRTLAPFRAITEALGYAVEWDSKLQTVTLQNEKKIIHLKMNSNEAVINIFDDGKMSETVTLEVPTKLINGRTFVPVRFLAENIGAEVVWDQNNRTIDIKTN